MGGGLHAVEDPVGQAVDRSRTAQVRANDRCVETEESPHTGREVGVQMIQQRIVPVGERMR